MQILYHGSDQNISNDRSMQARSQGNYCFNIYIHTRIMQKKYFGVNVNLAKQIEDIINIIVEKGSMNQKQWQENLFNKSKCNQANSDTRKASKCGLLYYLSSIIRQEEICRNCFQNIYSLIYQLVLHQHCLHQQHG